MIASERLGDAVKRWNEEERRLFRLMKTFKERARYAPGWAKRADAMESRWRRFRAGGPPPSPVTDQAIAVRIRGGDSARVALDLRSVGIDGLVAPFSEEVHFGERIGVIGPNGSGKSALVQMLAGVRAADCGVLRTGPRVSAGLFTQLQSRADFAGRSRSGHRARISAATCSRRWARSRGMGWPRPPAGCDVLSGGEKARLEVLILELEGHNLLLLDEPTDNLDTDSSEALEKALDSFERHRRRRISRPRVPAPDGPVPHGPSRRRRSVVPLLRLGTRGAPRPGSHAPEVRLAKLL